VFSELRGLFFNFGSLEKSAAVNLIDSGLQEPLDNFQLFSSDIFKIPKCDFFSGFNLYL